MEARRADLLQAELSDSLEGARATGLPHLVLLLGETGRGKSYAIQSFYDQLCQDYSGYWQPGLKPSWPPSSVAELRRERKRITPPQELRRAGERPSFLWLSVACSGSLDAPRLDPTAHLLRELQIAIGDAADAEIATTDRAKWVADRVLEGIGQLEPTFSLIKYLLQTVGEGPRELSAETRSFTSLERMHAYDTVHEYADAMRKLRILPPPLVVVIDDASAATDDLLSAVSALLAEPSQEQGTPTTTGLLPDVLEQMPPLPVLIIATAWDHAISEHGTATPFDRWLSEFRALGLSTKTFQCREMARSEADRMLDGWRFGPDATLRGGNRQPHRKQR